MVGSTTHRLARVCLVLGLAFAAAAGSCRATTAQAVTQPGTDAPPIVLKDLGGAEVSTVALAGKPLVLIFGELGHDGVRRACAEALEVVADPRVAADHAAPILIIAQDRPAEELKEEAARGRFPALVLHDPQRQTFGAYHVIVLPTVVVVDGKGKIVHTMPGFLPRFRDLLLQALDVAAGRESPEQLARSIAAPQGVPESEAQVRAARLAHLGDELSRHGLVEVAQARYAEAMALAPGYIPARLGMARLMLRQGRLDDAEAVWRELLEDDDTLLEARLGLAEVCVDRGGERLAEAEDQARAVLDRDARNARAHYLLGRVLDARGATGAAAASYRRAAELLLAR